MKTTICTLALAAALAGCSITLPVRGQFESGQETFTGTATGGMGGSGSLKVTSSKGATCDGEFVYTRPREGEGTFLCTDGRSGPFRFASTGTRGTGTGSLGGQPFTFNFGY